MKPLNFILFFALLITFFSCSKDTSELQKLDTVDAPAEILNIVGQEFFLPLAIDQGTEVEIQEYLENMTLEKLQGLVEHTRIAHYLGENNKLIDVIKTIDPTELLTIENTQLHLTENEMKALDKYTILNTNDKACGPWYDGGCYCEMLVGAGVCYAKISHQSQLLLSTQTHLFP